jgi:phenylacetate-CoA ligase
VIPTAIAQRTYFLLQGIRHEPVREALFDVKRTEFLPAEELRMLQADRQRLQLRFARRFVPYFEDLLEPFADRLERRLSWEEVRAILDALPVIEKGSALDHPERFRARNQSELLTYPDRTSGSSGTPLVFPCDQVAWAYRHALTFRCMEAFGVKVGEPYGLFFGRHWSAGRRMGAALRDRFLNRVRVSAFEVGPRSFDRHLGQLRKAKPTHLVGYPSALFSFCSIAKDRSVDLADLRLKAVFTTAEPLRPYQRVLIEDVTGSHCVNVYGSAEGGLMASECPAGSLHVCVETTWLAARGGEGRSGEAIVTDMMLRAFPLIRYAMGDEVELSEAACPCGRSQPVLAQVEGRSGDWIELRDGRRLNAHVSVYIFKPLAELGVIQRYRFVQAADGSITLWLVVSDRFNATHQDVLRRELKIVFGQEAPVIRIVQKLPPMPNAKHRDFVRI